MAKSHTPLKTEVTKKNNRKNNENNKSESNKTTIYTTGLYRGLVLKPERKRPLGRSRRTWEDNIKMDL